MAGGSQKINAAFAALGLVNNFTFVLFVTAAEKLMPGYAGWILFCTVVPGLLSRIVLNLFAERMPYGVRIAMLSVSSTFFCLVVAYAPSMTVKLLGLVLQAAFGALGEISFLALTHKFSESVVGAYASGTGAAGIAGAGAYVFCREVLKLSARSTLIACAPVSLLLIIVYQGALAPSVNNPPPPPPPPPQPPSEIELQVTSSDAEREPLHLPSLPTNDVELRDASSDVEREPLNMLTRREYLKPLLLTYMLPLAIVYFAEYTINQGVLSTLTQFKNHKTYKTDRTYSQLQFMYQLAVFISRSSISVVKINKLWVLPILQLLNLAILALCSMFVLLPSLNVAFIIVFWEGLLGGFTYVNAFFKLRTEAPTCHREWALGVATIGDATGISLAAVVSVWLEQAIENFRASS